MCTHVGINVTTNVTIRMTTNVGFGMITNVGMDLTTDVGLDMSSTLWPNSANVPFRSILEDFGGPHPRLAQDSGSSKLEIAIES